jgi:hypothetical protein
MGSEISRTHAQTHGDPDNDASLGFVGVDEEGEVVIVDVEVRAKVPRGGDRSEEVTEPPDDLGACAGVRSDNEDWFRKN